MKAAERNTKTRTAEPCEESTPASYEALLKALMCMDKQKWGTCLPSAAQVLRVWRMHKAAEQGETYADLKALLGLYTQGRYEALIVGLWKEHGVDLLHHLYAPDVSSATGMKMGVINDEPHILKCARSQTEGQDRKKGFDDAQALISKRRCQQACEGHFDLEAVSLALEGHTDKQNVAITENLFYSPQLRKRLEELSDWRTAAALAIIAEAYQSFELPGLDSAERSARLARMHQLTTCVLGRDIHDCHIKHWAGDVHSLTRRLLITMAECCPPVVPFHLGSMHVHGSMPSLTRTLRENSENQDFIMRSFPDAVANFCEKSTSTDCCELEHSSIVVRCVGAHVLHACTRAACLHGCIGWAGSLRAISTSAGCSPST